jgi:hypothetical protein
MVYEARAGHGVYLGLAMTYTCLRSKQVQVFNIENKEPL